LPAAWKPEPFAAETQAAARADRMGGDWVADELEAFCDHWTASGTPNARKCNWQSAWAGWLKIAEGKGRRRHDRGETDFANRRTARPSAALELYRQACADEAAETADLDFEADFGAGLALPPGRASGY
jgi:hypothetical protein